MITLGLHYTQVCLQAHKVRYEKSHYIYAFKHQTYDWLTPFFFSLRADFSFKKKQSSQYLVTLQTCIQNNFIHSNLALQPFLSL